MITERIQIAISKQINAELWSSYLYLAMSLDASAKNLAGVSRWFYVQWLEEQDHARILEHYLDARGVKPLLYPISSVPTGWGDTAQMFRDTLKHEREVTAMISKLVGMAFEERDYPTISRLQWFVDEQVEEEKTADELLHRFLSASDFVVLYGLDHELAGRKYKRASALEEYE